MSAEHVFKTVYFPGSRTRSGSPARVTISMPKQAAGLPVSQADLVRLHRLSGREIRTLVGDPVVEDLEDTARSSGRSLSNAVFQLLLASLPSRPKPSTTSSHRQLLLPVVTEPEKGEGLGVTFRDSKRLPVHGWYPYVEGFSAQYVADALTRFGQRPRSLFDPFGGAGTSMVVASHYNIPSLYCEVNPLMRFVADAKISSAAWGRRNKSKWRNIAKAFLSAISPDRLRRAASKIDLASYHAAFPNRDFFESQHLCELLVALTAAGDAADGCCHAENLLRLACAANTVRSSHMTRRADLRRRRPDEYKGRVVDVHSFLKEAVENIDRDIDSLPPRLAKSRCISPDARSLPADLASTVDFAVTSPPYLNGTNYFRNTKLELWLLGFLRTEDELAHYHRLGICAGINSVSSDLPAPVVFDEVEHLVATIEPVAYDRRIPKMIRHYCSDMYSMFKSTYQVLAPGAHFLMDIGDSCFCGVHVPTHTLLSVLATQAGFDCIATNTLARRYSRAAISLTQVELVFQKPRITKKRRGRR